MVPFSLSLMISGIERDFTLILSSFLKMSICAHVYCAEKKDQKLMVVFPVMSC